MAITISGENNNDRILASDGVIDQISGINIVGLLTAGHLNVGSNIQLGNAGIITATTFVGNLTGNVNSTSPLLLQTGGSERFRITGNNELGIAGANYGSSGQVLTSGGSGSAVSWTTIPTQVTISNNANDRVITGGSGTNLNGESTLTYGTTGQLKITRTSQSNVGLYVFHSDGNEVGHFGNIGSGNEGILVLKDGGTDTIQLNGETGGKSYINSGNVGIGSAIPSTKLDVVGGIKADGTIRIDNTASPTFYLTSTSTTGSSRIFFGDPDSDLVGRLSYAHNGDYYTFYAAYGERFRIAGNGDITVTSIDNFATGPTLKLFHNSASPAADDVVSRISMFGDDSAGNETEYGRIETVIDDTTDSQETGHINFATRGLGSFANVFRIKRRSTGSAPSYTADDADGVILDVYNTGNPYPRYMNFIAKSAGNTDSNIGFWTEAVGGSPTEKFRIDSSGDYLFLGGTLRIKNSANNAQYGAIYGDSTSFHVNAGANLKLYSGGGERVRFSNEGQISIRGTTTAFDTTGDLDSLQVYYETDSGQASIGPYSSGGSTHLSFYTNAGGAAATEKLRITSDGTTYFYGNQTSVPEGDFGFRWDRNSSVDFCIKNTNNTSVNAGARIKLIANVGNIALHYVNNGGFYLNNSASGYLHYYTGGTSRLYIDTSGNININNAGTIGTSNGGVGKRLGIKSNANNIIIGETEASGSFGLILESRVTGRSGDARSSQIGLGNGLIDFYTAAAGAGVTKKLEITSTGALQHTPASGVNYFTGTGEYVFGSATSSPPSGGYEANVQVHTSKTRASFSINAYMSGNAGGPFMQFLSSRSGTVGTLGGKVNSGDTLGEIRFTGDNGTNYNTVAYAGRISATSKSTPADGGTSMAGELNFYTNDSNGGSDNNVLKLRKDQQIEMPGARKVKINGVIEYYVAATMQNNQAYTFDFTVRSEGGYGNSYYIVVGYNHFHTTAYGAQRVAIVCTRGTALSINADISNVTHSQAGEWSFSKPDSTTLRITKSAGTYGGWGYGFVRMTGNGNTMGN